MEVIARIALLLGIVGAGLFWFFARGKKNSSEEQTQDPFSRLRNRLAEDPYNEESYEAVLTALGEAALVHKEGPFQDGLLQEFMGLILQMKEHVPYSQKPDLIRAKLLYELKASSARGERMLGSADALFKREILVHPYTLGPFIYWANSVGGAASFAGRSLAEQTEKWRMVNAILENALVYSHANPAFVYSKWVEVYLGLMANRHAKSPIRIAAAIQVARHVLYCLDNLEAWLLSHGLTMGQADREFGPIYQAFFSALEEIPYPFLLPLLDRYEQVTKKLTFISEDTTAARSLELIRLLRALESEDEETMLRGLEAFDRLLETLENNPDSVLHCHTLVARGYLFKATFADSEAQRERCRYAAISEVLASAEKLEGLSVHALHLYAIARLQMPDASRHPHNIAVHLIRQTPRKGGPQYKEMPSEYLRVRADYVCLLAEHGVPGYDQETLLAVAEACRKEAERRRYLPECVDRLRPSEESTAVIETLLPPIERPFGPLFPGLAVLGEE